VSQYRSVLSNRQALILLDNAADVEQVRPLLLGAPGITVVVTSRNQLSGLVAVEAARSVALGSFTSEETRWFLRRRIGRARADAEPGALEEIVDQCAGLPLALATVAARAAISPGFSLQALAGEVRELSALDMFVSSDGSVDVRASFSWSYQKLTNEAALLFRVLGSRVSGDVSVRTAAELTGMSHRSVRPLLVELCSVHLLSERAPGRYAMDRLLRAYAADLASRGRLEFDGVHVLPGRAG
jgi:hypothetical protein